MELIDFLIELFLENIEILAKAFVEFLFKLIALILGK